MMIKLFGVVLIILVIAMQYRIWLGDKSVQKLVELQAQIDLQQQQNKLLEKENTRLREEIRALRNDPAALEEQAREQLGLIKPGETFYRIVPRN